MRLTFDMLVSIMVHRSIHPQYLNFIDGFGIQNQAQRSPSAVHLLALDGPEYLLGGDRTEQGLCYAIHSVTKRPHPKDAWSIRLTAVYHGADHSGRTTMIITHANQDPHNVLIGKELDAAAMHQTIASWALSNWDDYFDVLEARLRRQVSMRAGGHSSSD